MIPIVTYHCNFRLSILVIFESPIRINKTITAFLTGSLCWVFFAVFYEGDHQLKFRKN
jgi:hypothetical protein